MALARLLVTPIITDRPFFPVFLVYKIGSVFALHPNAFQHDFLISFLKNRAKIPILKNLLQWKIVAHFSIRYHICHYFWGLAPSVLLGGRQISFCKLVVHRACLQAISIEVLLSFQCVNKWRREVEARSERVKFVTKMNNNNIGFSTLF